MSNERVKKAQKMLDEKQVIPQYTLNDHECKVYFVDISRNQLICTAEASRVIPSKPFYFNRLFVVPTYRHMGFASLAIRTMFELMPRCGFPVINLDINPYYNREKYVELEMFYTRLGFIRIIIQDGRDFYKTFYHADKSVGDVDINIFKVDDHDIVYEEKMYYVTDIEQQGLSFEASASWFDDRVAFWTDNSTAIKVIKAGGEDKDTVTENIRRYVQENLGFFHKWNS